MKKDRLNLTLTNTLNRALVYTVYPLDDPLRFSIVFNKKSCGLETQYDTRNDMITSGKVGVRLFRNLSNCEFANTFFKMESVQDDHGGRRRDFRTKFVGVNPMYKDCLLQSMAEKLELRTETEFKEKDKSNYIMISSWKLYDSDADLIFYFVQRKFYNLIRRTSIIRTMGIQFSTKNGFEILKQYSEDFKKNQENNATSEVPDYLRSGSVEENIFNNSR